MKPSNCQIKHLGACRIESPLASSQIPNGAEGTRIWSDITVHPHAEHAEDGASLELSGPRRMLYFEPQRARAAIVTCGGLCPGLNDVIRGITMVLWYRYGVRNILGLRYGYEGLVSSYGHDPVSLEPERVKDIHQQGGTILGSSRGAQDPADMVDFLQENKIDMLFAIGGDGTQRGALSIDDEIHCRGAKIAVVGVPKTIDNDISCTERTFGFQTAVALSRPVIASAHMEARGARNGIGLVKLMGRESGFLATHATLASGDVNLLLIPEVPFSLPKVLHFLEERLARKSHAVIVVAEGAGADLVPAEGRDASGNKKLGDVGIFLKKAISEHFTAHGLSAPIKYFDPSYTIRSVRANADDSVFCFRLAESAVHAAMAGKTRLVVGLKNGHLVNIPAEQAVRERKQIDRMGSLWASVLDNTGQPELV